MQKAGKTFCHMTFTTQRFRPLLQVGVKPCLVPTSISGELVGSVCRDRTSAVCSSSAMRCSKLLFTCLGAHFTEFKASSLHMITVHMSCIIGSRLCPCMESSPSLCCMARCARSNPWKGEKKLTTYLVFMGPILASCTPLRASSLTALVSDRSFSTKKNVGADAQEELPWN